MPLTKNLYREDECLAALKWYLMRSKEEEALFWAEECMDSNMHGELLGALLWAWCFSCGPSALPWITLLHSRVQEGITEEHLYELTHVLLKYRKAYPDASAFALLGIGLSDTGSVAVAPDYLTTLTGTPLEGAIKQGKAELAWYLARPMWSTQPWSRILTGVNLLETIADWFPVWSEDMTWPIRAVAIAAACSKRPAAPLENIVIPEPKIRDTPMRLRRRFAVPAECLYLFTARGCMRSNETTDTDLTHDLEENLRGSSFWDEYLSPLDGGTAIQREMFYDTFFPNDIPDEWSLKDRSKSHGPGYIPAHLEGDCKIINERCLERWFGSIPSRSIWNGTAAACSTLKEQWLLRPIASFTDGFHTAYSEKMATWEAQMKTWEFPTYTRELVIEAN